MPFNSKPSMMFKYKYAVIYTMTTRKFNDYKRVIHIQDHLLDDSGEYTIKYYINNELSYREWIGKLMNMPESYIIPNNLRQGTTVCCIDINQL